MSTQPSKAGILALQSEAGDIKDKLAGYVNAKTKVASYVASLLNTDISGVTFNALPEDLQKQLPKDPKELVATLQEELATARSHGMTWSNTIEPNLTAIPQAIINYNSQFQVEYNYMRPLVQDLINNPTDDEKRKQLISLFNGLLSKIEAQETSINEEIELIKQFNIDIHNDSLNFSNANSDFEVIRVWEKSNIDALNLHIAAIKDAIKALDTQITATAISSGASVALMGGGIYLMATAGPVGAIAGAVITVIGMIGVGVSVGFLISAIDKRAQEQSKLAKDQLNVSLLTQQVTALTTVETALGSLVKEAQDATKAVQIILDTWTTLKLKIQAVINDLQDSEKAIGDFMSLVDLDTAKEQWAQLQDFAEAMQAIKIEADYSTNKATLEVNEMIAS